MFTYLHGRIECDGCQEVENSTDLEPSRRKSFGQRFLFQHGGYEVSVCVQKNEAAWKGCTQ